MMLLQGETYGCAFRVSDEKAGATLRYLENRETKLGGYDSKITLFYPCEADLPPVKARLYIALPGNVDWRGPGKLVDIADEVSSSRQCWESSRLFFLSRPKKSPRDMK